MKSNTLESILAKVVIGENNCWLLPYVTDQAGYVRVSFQGKLALAHRLIYEQVNDTIPSNLECDHLCRNRACCNPEHIELVTHLENMQRGKNWNSKKTHCRNGHKFTEDNIYIHQDKHGHTHRKCRACRAVREKSK